MSDEPVFEEEKKDEAKRASEHGAPARAGDVELAQWTVLHDVSSLISAKSFDYERTARSVLDVALRFSGGEAGVVLAGEKGRDLQIRAAHEADGDAALEDPHLAELVQEAMKEGRIVARDLAAQAAFPRTGGARSILVLPLRVRLRISSRAARERRRYPMSALAKPLGAIVLARPLGAPLAPEQQRALETLVEHAGEALVNARLYHVATHDALTDFYTRRELEQHLAVELLLSEHSNMPVALLMVDIDGFSRVNERFGHARGDKVIDRVARLIRTNVRDEDACVRYGGEEFALILPGTDAQGAQSVAEKVRKAIAEYPGFGPGIELSVSIGIAVFPDHASSRAELLKKADQTLFQAKQDGGNRVLAWSRAIPAWALRSDKLIGIITGNQAKDYRNVMMLLDTVVIVNSLLERKAALATLLDMMIQLAASERGILFLEKDGQLRVELAQDQQRNVIEPKNTCEEVIARVREEGFPIALHAEGAAGEPEDEKLSFALRKRGLDRVVCVPLDVKARRIGCMYFDAPPAKRQGAPTAEFEESDLIFFQALAREIGNALEHARLYEENKKQRDELEQLNVKLERKLEAQEHELSVLERNLDQLKLKYNYDKIVGKSSAMQKIFKLLDKITDTDVPVLIQGETGTGKELVAKALHWNGPRREGPFVSVNCSAISESLMESELFGHVKGAFTGADQDKKGLFEQSDGGTIFLDEVQDMSRGMQRELLRVLQEGEIRRVGGKDIVKVDVRVISATNRDLRDLVKRGDFREDLFYRLNVVYIDLPPLRDRKEDVPLIVQRIMDEIRTRESRELSIEKGAMRALLRYDWPGNVRELENWVEKTTLMLEGDVIREGDVHLESDPSRQGGISQLFDSDYKNAKEAFLREYLKAVLARNGGIVTKAAQEAGIVRSSFHKMMRKHGLAAKDFGTRSG